MFLLRKFDVLGILLWFPIPIMRNVPIVLAKQLGEITAKYRWFAIVYIVASFFIIPLLIFSLSFAGWYEQISSNFLSIEKTKTNSSHFRIVFLAVLGPVFILILFVIFINILQVHHSKILPHRLQTWSWLPRPLRTLAWYDEHLFSSHKRLLCCNGEQTKPATIIINRSCSNKSTEINESFDDTNDELSGVSVRL